MRVRLKARQLNKAVGLRELSETYDRVSNPARDAGLGVSARGLLLRYTVDSPVEPAYGCAMRKIHLVTISAVAAAAVGSLVVCAIPAGADPEGELPRGPIAAPPLLPLAPAEPPAPTVPSPDAMAAAARHDRLAAYTLDVMNGWTHAVSMMPVADYDAVASDIAQAVILEPEGPVACDHIKTAPDGFKRCLWGVEGFNTDHAKAVLLAGLSYWEGARYAAYVDELRCQDDAWRVTPDGARLMRFGGDCDHKKAHSLFQIHPVEDHSSSLYALCSAEVIDGSRLGAARCALEIAGRSLKSTGTLSSYTGEFWGDHPKADVRLSFVRDALGKHPFLP